VTPARVVIVPYDPGWPAAFERERRVLDDLLAPWLVGPIEHIGSTAVAGLAAKPIIDIMAPVESLAASRGAIDAVKSAAYCYFPYRADVMHWFCKPSDEVRTHHLHIVPFGSPLWHERLAFRDALRADADVAARYASLKRELAVRYAADREAYTDAKADFIRETLGRYA
jgi:GrpB-like predicted nucleotidyltransferase (UPF0157 family)